MIDIHSHVIPGVDDGSQSMGMSLDMMRQAVESGTTHAFCTPHVMEPGVPPFPEEIRKLTTDVQVMAVEAGIPITLLPGSEVMLAPDLGERYGNGLIQSLGSSHYVLVDLPMGDLPQYTEDSLFELIVAGARPILAHPERCSGFMRKPDLLLELNRRGVLCQSNSGSFKGLFGPEVQSFAVRLVEAGQVQFMGSDGHTPGRRRMTLSGGLRELERITGTGWSRLVEDNPRMILESVDFPYTEPCAIKAKASWFGKLFGHR